MKSKQAWLWTILTVVSLLAALGCESATVANERALDAREQRLGVAGAPSSTDQGSELAPVQEGILWPPLVKLTQPGFRADLSFGHVVGLVPERGTCPPPDGTMWTGGALFGDVTVPPEPPLSGKFCAYRRKRPEAVFSQLPRYCPFATAAHGCSAAAPAPEKWLEPVPKGVVALGLGDATRLQVATAMRERFGKLLGVPGKLPSTPEGQPTLNGPLPLSRTVWTLDDGGEHSKAVMQTVLSTACPGGLEAPCPIKLETSNVFGAGDVTASALKVVDELFLAVQALRASAVEGAVFVAPFGVHHANMTEPPSNGGTNSAPRIYLAYEALKAAINYAACSNYLFVAAIGNRDGGPSDSSAEADNPMFPGGWADQKRAWHCGRDLPVEARPLLLAAGAINGDGSDSLTTRVNGQAEYVTPGYAVPLDLEAKGRLYWEGSSFSAAALAGVVAAAWSYMPHARPSAVLDVLRSTAQPLAADRFTHLCHTGTKCQVRRVHLCNTLKKAINHTGQKYNDPAMSTLQASLSCSLFQPSGWTDVALDPAARDAIVDDGEPKTWSPVEALPSTTACGAEARAAEDLERAPYSCPFELFGNGQEERQRLECTPPGHGCSVCTVAILADNDIRFIGGIDRDIVPILSSPVLRVRQLTNVVGATGGPTKSGVAPNTGSAVASDQFYELSGLLDTEDETHVILDAQVNPATRALEVMLEYVVTGDDQTPRAQGVPIPVIDLR